MKRSSRSSSAAAAAPAKQKGRKGGVAPAPVPDRDALGRQRRAERRRIEELKRRRGPFPAGSRRSIIVAVQQMVAAECARLELSPNAVAELSCITRPTAVIFLQAEGRGSCDTMARILWGLSLEGHVVFLQARRWLEDPGAVGR